MFHRDWSSVRSCGTSSTIGYYERRCYADDTFVAARGKREEAAILATTAVAQVVTRKRRLGLEMALNKSEVLSLHGPRNVPPA